MEKWTDIPGFEGIYQVSTKGRVKRLEHWKNQRTNRSDKWFTYKKLPEKILSASTAGRYSTVQLSKDRKICTRSVHRLVASAFIPNPDGLPEINHIDQDGHNNRVENLEWCDRKYNINYGDRTDRANEKIKKAVICIDTSKIYASGTDAAKATKIHKSKISQVCNGKRMTAGGFHWAFA